MVYFFAFAIFYFILLCCVVLCCTGRCGAGLGWAGLGWAGRGGAGRGGAGRGGAGRCCFLFFKFSFAFCFVCLLLSRKGIQSTVVRSCTKQFFEKNCPDKPFSFPQTFTYHYMSFDRVQSSFQMDTHREHRMAYRDTSDCTLHCCADID